MRVIPVSEVSLVSHSYSASIASTALNKSITILSANSPSTDSRSSELKLSRPMLPRSKLPRSKLSESKLSGSKPSRSSTSNSGFANRNLIRLLSVQSSHSWIAATPFASVPNAVPASVKLSGSIGNWLVVSVSSSSERHTSSSSPVSMHR